VGFTSSFNEIAFFNLQTAKIIKPFAYYIDEANPQQLLAPILQQLSVKDFFSDNYVFQQRNRYSYLQYDKHNKSVLKQLSL